MFYTLAQALTNYPELAGMLLFAGIAYYFYCSLKKQYNP